MESEQKKSSSSFNPGNSFPANRQMTRSMAMLAGDSSSEDQFTISETSESIQLFQDLLGYDYFFNDRVRGFRSQQAIDRFIPNRKESQYDCLKSSAEEPVNEENLSHHHEDEPKPMTVAEIYRKHILKVNLSQNEQAQSFVNRNNLRFRSKPEEHRKQPLSQPKSLLTMKSEIYQSLPFTERKISKTPFKVLDAPNLQDDFYLNLIDWSATNVLAVALGSSVYMWNAVSSKVSKLCEVAASEMITSVIWSPASPILAVGTSAGDVQLWDSIKSKLVRTLQGHTSRVGSMAWNNNHILSSGSKDKTIMNRDTRDPALYTERLVAHKQEVCGLKWSFNGQQLASGGNDNKIYLWNMNSNLPQYTLSKHTAAVKALAWSPHQYGLLVSGGGTADKTIRFWNTLTGEQVNSYEVGSQVCNVMFSKTVNELVSTHGYSLNEINLWKYPKMEKLATLSGHTLRVLYLSMSPDGSTIVTGAGDETLRFWNIFPSSERNAALLPSELTSTICLR